MSDNDWLYPVLVVGVIFFCVLFLLGNPDIAQAIGDVLFWSVFTIDVVIIIGSAIAGVETLVRKGSDAFGEAFLATFLFIGFVVLIGDISGHLRNPIANLDRTDACWYCISLFSWTICAGIIQGVVITIVGAIYFILRYVAIFIYRCLIWPIYRFVLRPILLVLQFILGLFGRFILWTATD